MVSGRFVVFVFCPKFKLAMNGLWIEESIRIIHTVEIDILQYYL